MPRLLNAPPFDFEPDRTEKGEKGVLRLQPRAPIYEEKSMNKWMGFQWV